MKKVGKSLPVIAALLLLFFLNSSSSMAGVKFGVKGGLTLAKIKSVPDNYLGYPWQTKQGLVEGVFAEIELVRNFSLQPEVLYVQKGAKTSFEEGGDSYTLMANIDYIEIPLLLKFNFISGGPTIPSIYFGPFVGFNTKGEGVIKFDGYIEGVDIKNELKSTDYGLVFGLGLTQNLGVIKITFDARYDLGSSNIQKVLTELFDSVKTRTWLFMVGICF